MTDYSKMSDQKINEMVAIALGEKIGERVNGMQLVAVDGEKISSSYDPCNNQADAWPIIIENKISIISMYSGGDSWQVGAGEDEEFVLHQQSNPFRAAMIVFLMMKEAGNV